MTKAEYEARKRWDTSIMTEEEKEAHKQHIFSMYGKITDDTRIKESLKTIEYLLEKEAKIIILSHLGKVKTEEE